MKAKIFAKDNAICKEIAKSLKNDLKEANIEIDEDNFEYAISIGGDGTFLKMIRKCKFDTSINYIGINAGGVGYLTSLTPEDISSFIDALKGNELVSDTAPYLKIRIKSLDTKDDIVFKAVNELAIKASSLTSP